MSEAFSKDLINAIRMKAIEDYFKISFKEVVSALKFQELAKTDSSLHHDLDCIHNKGKSKCINCHVRNYIEFLIEESKK